MESSDDEDVHQCGRCKEIFYSIDEYFVHKKSKVCRRSLESSQTKEAVISTPATIDIADTPIITLNKDNANATTSYYQVNNPVKVSGEELANPEQPVLQTTQQSNGIVTECVTEKQESTEATEITSNTTEGNTENAENNVDDNDVVQSLSKKEPITKDESQCDPDDILPDNNDDGEKTVASDEDTSKVTIDLNVDIDGKASKDSTVDQELYEDDEAGDLSRKSKRKARPKKLSLLADDEEIDYDENDPEFTPNKIKTEPNTTTRKKRKRGRPRRGEEVNKKPKIKIEPRSHRSISIAQPEPVEVPVLRKRRGRPPKDPLAHVQDTKPERVTVYACPLCAYNSEFRDELDRHLRRVHKMSLHNCEFCKKSFSDKYKLQKHILDGKCQYNTGVFPGTEIYDNIESSYIDEEVESDDDADITLEEEQEKAKKKAVPLFKCYECGDIYDSFIEVREHVTKRHGEDRKCRPAICELCGKWFGNKEKYWRHLTATVHDDISDEDLTRIRKETANMYYNWKPPSKKSSTRLFGCEQCAKSFKYREAYNKHVKYIHPEDGQLLSYKFTCSCCKEQFNHRRTYLTHLKVEHGIKDGGPEDYRCQVCAKNFKQKAHKYRHIESLHTPIQLVPDSIIPLLENEGYLAEICMSPSETSDETKDESEHLKNNIISAEDNNEETANKIEDTTQKVGLAAAICGEDEGFSENVTEPTDDVKKIDKIAEEASILVNNGKEGIETSLSQNTNEKHILLRNQIENPETPTDNQKRVKKVQKKLFTMDWLTCPICSEKVASRLQQLKHLQLHRVWVLKTVRGLAAEGVHAVFDGLNLRMPNIPQGLTDRETGLAIEDVLVPKTTTNGIPVPQPDETAFNSEIPDTFNNISENQEINLENTFDQTQGSKETGLNTIDQSVIRDLVHEDPRQPEKFSLTANRSVIYSAVQKIVQDIKIKQLIGPVVEEENNTILNTEVDGEKSNGPFVCPFCFKVHKSLLDCYKHVTMDHNMIAAFQCVHKGCRQVFGYVHDFEKHIESHRQAAFICRVCNMHFQEMLDAVSHKSSAHRTLHQTEVNRCDLCNRTFTSKDALSKHITMDKHHHQCDECGKVLKNANDLKDHELLHRGIRAYLCDQCGSAFANKIQLTRHRKLHSTTQKILQCDQCPATFAKREHLKRHMQTQHTDEKPFACQYPGCDKAFKRKDKLQDHYRMHSNETPYVCAVCGKAYRYREALKYHEKTHLKECKHFCTMCDAGFPRPAALRAHLREKHHINLKHQHSYPCPQCGNVFSRPERLKRHMEFRHSVPGEWKFKCPICSRGCAGKKSYKSHMLKKHSLDGPIEELINIDATPFLNMQKQRRKKTEVKPKEELLPIVEQQPEHQQQLQQQQTVPTQIRVEENLSSVATILQSQPTHQSITLQNPQDPGGSTIYLIPSNLSEKDQLMQNMVGLPQLVMTPSGLQGHTQTHQIAAAPQHPTQPVAIHNNPTQNVTLSGTGGMALPASAAAAAHGPVHTVLMTTHSAIPRPEPTAGTVNLHQVSTSHAQPHNTFPTISSSYTGFVNNYEQY